MSVHIKDVSLSFKSQDALQKVSLILSPHEITYILGPNGAGKSALVNCIAGLHTRYTGSISIPAGTKMGALTNQPFRYSFLSVKDNIRVFLRYNQMEFYGYHQLLNQHLNLDEILDKRFQTLSQGQKQRVLIFLSVINDPEIILLDEPFQGLDPFYSEKLIVLLNILKNQGRTIMINDHIISHTIRLADKIAFLIKHRNTLTIPYHRIDEGVFYHIPDTANLPENGSSSFGDHLFTSPPKDKKNLRRIENLTELYTLAIDHEKHKSI